ncbi:hypothetical protein AGMMS50212_14640 [Spirochaetia bacterium]|nr:hypothetical protein AGMMS50212_14640 [Spirochaetia bacterium]
MKKVAIIVLILTATAGVVSAQDTFSVGIGVEANGYSSNELFGIAPVLAFDYRFNEMWAVGARALYALDIGAKSIGDTTALELNITGRWYFLRWKSLVDYYFMWQNRLHFFIQADVGLSITNYAATPNISGTAPNLGGELGIRIMFDKIYVEPYGRFSVQLAEKYMGQTWGAGVLVGYTFHSGRGGY